MKTSELNLYRINEQTGSIHKYDTEQDAYLFFGSTLSYSDEQLRRMEELLSNDFDEFDDSEI